MENQALRPWQADCLVKARNWFVEQKEDLFLINAAPGAGKTLTACIIAKSLIDDDPSARHSLGTSHGFGSAGSIHHATACHRSHTDHLACLTQCDATA